jgi:hypothetical protein
LNASFYQLGESLNVSLTDLPLPGVYTVSSPQLCISVVCETDVAPCPDDDAGIYLSSGCFATEGTLLVMANAINGVVGTTSSYTTTFTLKIPAKAGVPLSGDFVVDHEDAIVTQTSTSFTCGGN